MPGTTNQKNQQKAPPRLIWRLFILSVLLTTFAFLTSAELTPTHAVSGWSECDVAFIDNAVPGCINTHNQCLAACANDPQCESGCVSSYQSCMAGANTAHTDCLYSSTPQPLPVIDTRRSDCMAGCQSCYDLGYTIEALFNCALPCQNYCAANFPKP
jgi:hypothetical protein